MPYHIDSDHSECEGHAVVKDDTGEMVDGGCHMSMADAEKHMAALYAAESGRAQMTAKSINDLPDSAFAYIEPGGTKDESGKTVPRSKRHFPIHDAAHVRNALARAPQSPFGRLAMPKIKAAAKKFGISVGGENSADPPVDNLVRSMSSDDAVHVADEGRTLFGHFAVFDQWTEIDSLFEGRFLERIAPGAFEESFTSRRDRIKVLYDHGKDPQLGNKPLGPLTELREDEVGGYYEVDLIPADYNDGFIIPAARAGVLGASFRFSIPDGGQEWTKPSRATEQNPDRLKERTIRRIDVYELGPVTFPAYVGATTAVRSGTDDFIDSLTRDPRFLARFVERAGLTVVEHVLESLPATPRDRDLPATPQIDQEDDSADGEASPVQWTSAARRRFARQIEAEHLGVGKE